MLYQCWYRKGKYMKCFLHGVFLRNCLVPSVSGIDWPSVICTVWHGVCVLYVLSVSCIVLVLYRQCLHSSDHLWFVLSVVLNRMATCDLYRLCLLPSVSWIVWPPVVCTVCVLYHLCLVPSLSCTVSVLNRLATWGFYCLCLVPSVLCTVSVLYRHCLESSGYLWFVPFLSCTACVLQRLCLVLSVSGICWPPVVCTVCVLTVLYRLCRHGGWWFER